MAAGALVDSSVWIGLLRERRELANRARLFDLATCGMIRLEVLRAIARQSMFDAVRRFQDVMIHAPSGNRVGETATREAWHLGRKGVTLPVQDLVIAACTIRIEACVLTYDDHFFRHSRGDRAVLPG